MQPTVFESISNTYIPLWMRNISGSHDINSVLRYFCQIHAQNFLGEGSISDILLARHPEITTLQKTVLSKNCSIFHPRWNQASSHQIVLQSSFLFAENIMKEKDVSLWIWVSWAKLVVIHSSSSAWLVYGKKTMGNVKKREANWSSQVFLDGIKSSQNCIQTMYSEEILNSYIFLGLSFGHFLRGDTNQNTHSTKDQLDTWWWGFDSLDQSHLRTFDGRKCFQIPCKFAGTLMKIRLL